MGTSKIGTITKVNTPICPSDNYIALLQVMLAWSTYYLFPFPLPVLPLFCLIAYFYSQFLLFNIHTHNFPTYLLYLCLFFVSG